MALLSARQRPDAAQQQLSETAMTQSPSTGGVAGKISTRRTAENQLA